MFASVYLQPAGDDAIRDQAERETDDHAQNDQVPPRPDGWTDSVVKTTCDIMATTATHLKASAARVQLAVGRITQQAVWDLVQQGAPTLRAGMGLEAIQVGPMKRLREDCEPDDETRQKRAVVLKEQEKWQQIRSVYDLSFSQVIDGELTGQSADQ